jgi:membrane fusion protein
MNSGTLFARLPQIFRRLQRSWWRTLLQMPDRYRAPATPNTPLFRTEALRYRTDPVLGSVLIAAPVSFTLSAIAATLFACTLIGILVFGRYTQRETVSGYVATTDGEVRVFPQAAGTVDGLLVSEGDRVIAGTPLISLSTSRNSGMSTAANTEILAALIAERSALDEQQQQQQRYYARETERLRNSVSNTGKLIGTLRKQQRLARKRHGIVRRDLERAQAIRSSGYLSDKELDVLAIAALDSELNIESNQLRIDELESARQDTESRLMQLEYLQRTRFCP